MQEQKNIELYHASFFRIDREHDEERAGYSGVYVSSPRGEGFVEIRFGKGSGTKRVKKLDARNLRHAIQNHAQGYADNTITAYCNGQLKNLTGLIEKYDAHPGFNIPAEAALLRPIGPTELERITAALESCRDILEPSIVLTLYKNSTQKKSGRHITRENSAIRKQERAEKLKQWEYILR